MTDIKSKPNGSQNGVMRLIMVFLLAAMAQSLVVGIHESVHALTCVLVGRDLVELSALHVDCRPEDVLSPAIKLVAGSAAFVNLILGTIIYFVLRSKMTFSSTWKWFLWFSMFAHWSNGLGYFLFSGISGVGDLAVVIAGWQPAALWRVGMVIIGGILWFASIWVSLRVLATIFGGDAAQIRSRFHRLSLPSYFGAILVAVLAGAMNTYGLMGLPSIAGILAVSGTLSPMIWMPYWFASNNFTKHEVETIEYDFDWRWIIAAILICLFYVLVLGRGLTFAAVG